jgi:hypothetical protein
MTITRAFYLTLLLFLFSLAAHGSTLVVEREVPPDVTVVGTSFDADRDLGQAWVVVDFAGHDGSEDQIYSERVPMPGLTYDAATRTIHL